MRIEGAYLLGTIHEVAQKITEEITDKGTISALAVKDFPGVDFAVADLVSDRLEDIADNSEGWFGIKRINTGFDNYGYDFFADYYGGGAGIYQNVERNEQEEIVKSKIQGMIIRVVLGETKLYGTELLIAQFSDRKREWRKL